MRYFTPNITAGLLSLGALLALSLPATARPATLSTEDANGRVNLRSSASVRSEILEELRQGSEVEVVNIVLGRDGFHWYYVNPEVEGTLSGWVRNDFVRFKPSNERYATLKGERNDKINVRSGPRLKSTVLHYGLVGDLVSVGQTFREFQSYRWYEVTFPSQAKGWVREDLLSVWPQGCIITCPDN